MPQPKGNWSVGLRAPISFGLREVMIAVTVLAVALGLVRMFEFMGLVAVFVSACIFTYWLYTYHQVPLQRLPDWLSPAKSRWLFDVIWGLGMPLLCLWGDPFVFSKSNMGIFEFQGQWKHTITAIGFLAYPFLGYQLLLMATWLLFGHRLSAVAGFFAGGLSVGVAGAALIGVCLLPYSILGAMLLGIGLLGITPFLTTRAFARRTLQAAALSRGSHVVTWIVALISVFLAIAIPYFIYLAIPHGDSAELSGVPRLLEPLFGR